MTRVLLVSKYPLFGRGIQSLLRQQFDIDILGQIEPIEAIERIRDLRPEVVITDSTEVSHVPDSIVAQILAMPFPPRVIGLNLEDNTLHIYQGEQREAKGIEDLVAAIRPSQPAIPDKV